MVAYRKTFLQPDEGGLARIALDESKRLAPVDPAAIDYRAEGSTGLGFALRAGDLFELAIEPKADRN
jgi:hypothetical protein